MIKNMKILIVIVLVMLANQLNANLFNDNDNARQYFNFKNTKKLISKIANTVSVVNNNEQQAMQRCLSLHGNPISNNSHPNFNDCLLVIETNNNDEISKMWRNSLNSALKGANGEILASYAIACRKSKNPNSTTCKYVSKYGASCSRYLNKAQCISVAQDFLHSCRNFDVLSCRMAFRLKEGEQVYDLCSKYANSSACAASYAYKEYAQKILDICRSKHLNPHNEDITFIACKTLAKYDTQTPICGAYYQYDDSKSGTEKQIADAIEDIYNERFNQSKDMSISSVCEHLIYKS